ncbi:transporter substrate-binding domain-containing protein [Pseudomonas sp. GOM7]|uniref:substrate-binding periplasmic protein n=1 Tax=Pseudomonas sp. GOM7 TaxID=2998079 RepID=UPI00227B6F65|nr:transporter substrate-binding domain-containing protein [Pseudomonas sp. GOM7]WAJ36927.1 transporter substrate-binding domain-containing protein [Pseudomonas sp. GOM7]
MFKSVVCAVLLCCCSAANAAGELRLYTEDNRPYGFLEAGKLDGMTVQVVKELVRRSGQPAQIELVPWTRGYHQVQREADAALFPVVRTPEREALFQWVGPIVVGRTGFYSRRADNIRVHNLDDVRRFGTLAVPKQWYIHEQLLMLGMDNLHGVSKPSDMVRLFHHGRVKLIVANDLILEALLAGEGMSVDQVQWQFDLMPNASYIAFSKAAPPERVARWRQLLAGMRADGSLERLYRQWFPHADEAHVAALLHE